MIAIEAGETPPQIGSMIHSTIREVTGKKDPYREIKRLHNEQVLGIKRDLERLIDESSSPLPDALKLAAMGNLIDMGPERQWNEVGDIFRDFSKQTPSIFDYELFENSLETAGKLLYLGDNAGEIVLDTILVELLRRETNIDITYAVRGGPVINDATMEDASLVGMTDMVRVIDTGVDFPGIVPEACSDEFLYYYNSVDIILSKGQGNYESLSEADRNIFFLLQTKCPVIANKIGCSVGDIILKSQYDHMASSRGETRPACEQ